MVAQVFADAGQLVRHRNLVRHDIFRIADARELKQLRRIHDATCQKNLQAGLLRSDSPAMGILKAGGAPAAKDNALRYRSEEHTSELQSLMSISYAVFFLKKKQTTRQTNN